MENILQAEFKLPGYSCMSNETVKRNNHTTNMNESEIMEIIKMKISLKRTKNQINPLTGIPSKVIHIK